jgi:hypothetical protein
VPTASGRDKVSQSGFAAADLSGPAARRYARKRAASAANRSTAFTSVASGGRTPRSATRATPSLEHSLPLTPGLSRAPAAGQEKTP